MLHAWTRSAPHRSDYSVHHDVTSHRAGGPSSAGRGVPFALRDVIRLAHRRARFVRHVSAPARLVVVVVVVVLMLRRSASHHPDPNFIMTTFSRVIGARLVLS